MKKFTFEITLQAESEKEAHDKMKALSVFAGRLDSKTLLKFAHVVKNDPTKLKLAKSFLGLK